MAICVEVCGFTNITDEKYIDFVGTEFEKSRDKHKEGNRYILTYVRKSFYKLQTTERPTQGGVH